MANINSASSPKRPSTKRLMGFLQWIRLQESAKEKSSTKKNNQPVLKLR